MAQEWRNTVNVKKNSPGYSGTPLFKKLGMKGGSRWKLIDFPGHYFEILGEVEDVTFVSEGVDLDGIHAFTNRIEDLELYLIQCSREIHKKGSSGFPGIRKAPDYQPKLQKT